MKAFTLSTLTLTLLPTVLQAATGATCVSVTDSTIGNAAGGAVLVMFAVLAGLFTAVAFFAVNLVRRGKALAAREAAEHGAQPDFHS